MTHPQAGGGPHIRTLGAALAGLIRSRNVDPDSLVRECHSPGEHRIALELLAGSAPATVLSWQLLTALVSELGGSLRHFAKLWQAAARECGGYLADWTAPYPPEPYRAAGHLMHLPVSGTNYDKGTCRCTFCADLQRRYLEHRAWRERTRAARTADKKAALRYHGKGRAPRRGSRGR